MSFRYIITDTFDGCLKGTDDAKIAEEFAVCEDYFVYDTQEAVWLMADGEKQTVTKVVRSV